MHYHYTTHRSNAPPGDPLGVFHPCLWPLTAPGCTLGEGRQASRQLSDASIPPKMAAGALIFNVFTAILTRMDRPLPQLMASVVNTHSQSPAFLALRVTAGPRLLPSCCWWTDALTTSWGHWGLTKMQRSQRLPWPDTTYCRTELHPRHRCPDCYHWSVQHQQRTISEWVSTV